MRSSSVSKTLKAIRAEYPAGCRLPGFLWNLIHYLAQSFDELLEVVSVETHAQGGSRPRAHDQETPRKPLVIPEEGHGSRTEAAEGECVLVNLMSSIFPGPVRLQ